MSNNSTASRAGEANELVNLCGDLCDVTRDEPAGRFRENINSYDLWLGFA